MSFPEFPPDSGKYFSQVRVPQTQPAVHVAQKMLMVAPLSPSQTEALKCVAQASKNRSLDDFKKVSRHNGEWANYYLTRWLNNRLKN